MVAIWLLLVLCKVSRDKTGSKALFWPKLGFCPGPGWTCPLQHVGNKGNSHPSARLLRPASEAGEGIYVPISWNHLYQKPQECQGLFLIWLVEHREMMELKECLALNADQGNSYAHSLSLKSTRSIRGSNNWRCLRLASRVFTITSSSPWT